MQTPYFRTQQKQPDIEPYTSLPHACRTLLDAKASSGLSYEQIAKKMGRGEVYVAAIMFGQATPTEDDLKKLAEVLGIDLYSITAELGKGYYPQRGLGPMPPQDPVIYRLYEAVMVYGHPLKAIINEKFGDGIMSAINMGVKVEKVADKGGDRVKITMNGKWLPYDNHRGELD